MLTLGEVAQGCWRGHLHTQGIQTVIHKIMNEPCVPCKRAHVLLSFLCVVLVISLSFGSAVRPIFRTTVDIRQESRYPFDDRPTRTDRSSFHARFDSKIHSLAPMAIAWRT